jgi:hypothetical protein
MRYVSSSKPEKCPNCGSKKVARIMWGLPALTPELVRDEKEGRLILGGCCVSDDDPRWQCTDCNVSIYEKE